MLPIITNLTLQKLFDHGFSISIDKSSVYKNTFKYKIVVTNDYYGIILIQGLKTVRDALIVASFLYLEMIYKSNQESTFQVLREEGLLLLDME